MNLSAFKNPTVISALFGAVILGAGGAYFAMDNSQRCPQMEAMEAQIEALSADKEVEDEALKRLHAPSSTIGPDPVKKNYLPF